MTLAAVMLLAAQRSSRRGSLGACLTGSGPGAGLALSPKETHLPGESSATLGFSGSGGAVAAPRFTGPALAPGAASEFP